MRYIVLNRMGHRICCNCMPVEPNTYRLLMLWSEDELLWQIQNVAAAQGASSVVEGDATGELLEQFKTICDKNNVERVITTIKLALSRCERIFHQWSQQVALKHSSIDNHPREQVEHSMELQVTETFRNPLAWGILRWVQEYITAYVLWDWAGITYKEGQETWAMKVEDAENELKAIATMMNDGDEARIAPWC